MKAPRANGATTAKSSNVVQFVVQASDQASRTFEQTAVAVQMIGYNVDVVKTKFVEFSGALLGAGGSAFQQFTRLREVLGVIRDTLNSPVVKPFIEVIRDEADAATQSIAPLTSIMRDLAAVTGGVGAGFLGTGSSAMDESGKALIELKENIKGLSEEEEALNKKLENKDLSARARRNLETQKEVLTSQRKALEYERLQLDTLDGKLDRVADKIRDFIIKPFQGAGEGNGLTKFIGNFAENLKLGEIAQRFDQSLASALTKGALETLLGDTIPAEFVEAIATNPLLKDFVPGFAQDILGGSVFKPLGEMLNLNQLMGGKPLQVPVEMSGEGLNKFLAGFTLDRALSQTIGDGAVQDILKNVIKPVAGMLGPEFVKQLTQGSFTGALRALFVSNITSSFKTAFQTVDTLTTQLFGNIGVKAAERLINGPSEALKRLLAGRFKELDGVFSGVTGQAIKGFDIMKLFPGLDQLDNLLGSKISKALGGAVDRVLSAKASQLIQNKALETASGVIAQGLSQLAPEKLRSIVASSLSNTSLTRFIAAEGNKLFQNLLKTETAQDISQRIQEMLKPLTDSDVFQKFNQALQSIASGAKGIFGGVIRESAGGAAKILSAIQENAGPAFKKLDDFFEGIFSGSFREIGRNAGGSFAGSFVKRMLSEIGPAVNQIDSLVMGAVDNISSISGRLAAPMGGIAAPFGAIAGFNEPLEILNIVQETMGGVTSGIMFASEKLTFLSSGLQAFQQLVANGPFKLLIGQTIELREQLLSTQASLVGTNKIIQNGVEIKDPTQAIKSLTQPVEESIKKMRLESLDLVGITSKDLVPLYQIIAGNISSMGGDLTDVKDLSLDFAASLGTLQIPIGMARQEITSIVAGTIDMNSALAKSLGITNEQVANWKSQGKLITELRSRLEAFRAGNKLAAASMSGVASNIQEVFDEIGRKAGEPLLDPIIKELTAFYEYLKKNQESLAEGLGEIVEQILRAGLAGVEAIKAIFTSTKDLLAQIPVYLFKSLANTVVEFSNALKNTLTIIQPAIDLIVELAKSAYALGGPFLKLFLQFKVLEIGISSMGRGFGLITQLLPGVGDLLFLITGRSSGMINQFVNLSNILKGPGAAGFLLLGKNLNSIPGLAGAAAGALGPFGGILVGLVPAIAGVGIQMAGLIKMAPVLGDLARNFLALSPGLLGKIAGLAGSTGLLGGALAPLSPLLLAASGQLAQYANATSLAEVVNNKFKDTLIAAGKAIRGQIISFGFLAAGTFLAFQAIDKFILKNDELRAVLNGVFQGTLVTIKAFFAALTNPMVLATGATIALAAAIKLQLIPAMLQLMTTQMLGWANGAAGALLKLAGILKTVGFLGMASSASSAATSINALIIGLTQGNAAMVAYIGTQKAATVSNAQVAASTGAASFSFGALTKKIIAASVAMVKFAVTAIVSVVRSMVSIVVGLATGTLSFGTLAAAAGTAAASCWAFVTATVAGTGGLFALVPALGAGSAGFAGIAVTAGGAVVAIGALLLPLAAVAGAIAIVASLNYAQVLKDSTEATDEYGRQADQTAQITIKTAEQLKAAKERQETANKQGIRLSEEEYAANKQLQFQAKQQIGLIDEQVKGLKEAKKEVVGDEQKNAIQANIDMLEGQKSTLLSLSSNIEIAAKELPVLGTAFSQMSLQAASAMTAIEKSNGNPEMFKQKAQEVMDITQIQVEQGQITVDEAIKRYQKLANLTTADRETQIKAQKAITDAYKIEADKRLELSKVNQENIQALTEAGNFGEAAGDRKLTEAKREELQTRLNDLKIAKAEEDRLRQDAQKIDLDKLDKDIADATKTRDDAIAKGDAKGVGDATRVLQGLTDKRSELERGYQNSQLESDRKFNVSKQQLDNESIRLEAEALQKENQQKILNFEEQQSIEQSELDRRLQTQEQFNAATLQIAQDRLDEEVNQIQDQRNKLDPTDTDGLEALAVKEAEARAKFVKTEKEINQKRRETRLKDFDEELSIEQAQLDSRLQTEEQFNQDSLKLARDRLKEELTQIQALRDELAPGDVQGEQELAVREAQARAKLARAEFDVEQKRKETRLKDFDEQQTEQDALYAQKLLTEEEYAQKSLNIMERRAAEELRQIEDLRAKLPQGDRQGQEQLDARTNEVRKRLAEEREKFEQQQAQRKIQAFDNVQKVLEGQFADGNLTEQEFNQQSLENTQQKLDAELAEVERQRSRLKSTDREALLALEAQEADILKRRNDAQEQFWQRQIDMVKRAQQKVLDELTLSQTKRDIEFQKAINRNQLTEAEVGALRVDQTREELEEKLKLEQQFLSQLEALPKSNDPVKREQQEAEIRQSVQKTYDITLQLAQNEQQQQEAQQKLIQERIQEQIDGIQNLAEAERMASELRLQQFEVEQTFMESRLRILQAQMQMQDAVNSFRSSEYSIAENLTKSERKKAKIAEEAAKAEFDAAKTRIAMKRTELALTEAQNQALIERKRIELESKKSDAKANLAEQLANREMVNADPRATAAQKYAADLKVEAALNKGAQLEVEGALINREEKSQRYFDAVQRQQFELGSEAELDQAEANYVGKTRKKRDDRKLAKKSLKKARRAKNMPFVPLPEFDELDAEGIRARYMEQFGMGGAAPQTPTLSAKQQISLTPPPVPVVVPGRQGQIQSPTDDKLLAAIANLEKTFQASAGGGPITLQTTIQNTINAANQNDIKSAEQSQINAQYKLVEELERRRRK